MWPSISTSEWKPSPSLSISWLTTSLNLSMWHCWHVLPPLLWLRSLQALLPWGSYFQDGGCSYGLCTAVPSVFLKYL